MPFFNQGKICCGKLGQNNDSDFHVMVKTCHFLKPYISVAQGNLQINKSYTNFMNWNKFNIRSI